MLTDEELDAWIFEAASRDNRHQKLFEIDPEQLATTLRELRAARTRLAALELSDDQRALLEWLYYELQGQHGTAMRRGETDTQEFHKRSRVVVILTKLLSTEGAGR